MAAAAPARAEGPADATAYTYSNSLEASRIETLTGSRNLDGSCDWPQFPEMLLGPNDTALTTRELSSDPETCSTTVEIGRPGADADQAESASYAEMQSSAVAIDNMAVAGGADQPWTCPYAGPRRVYRHFPTLSAYDATGCFQGAGYFKVNWFDIVGIKVNEITENLSFVVDGACVITLSGSAQARWRSGTGWQYERGAYIIEPVQPGFCDETRSMVLNAEFVNPTFCRLIFNVFASPSRTTYDKMLLTAYRVNYLGGSVHTENSGGQLCPPLHHEEKLERTSY